MPRQPCQPHQPTQLINPNQPAITKVKKPLRNQDATEPISKATVVAKKGEILLSNRQDATEPTTAIVGRGKGKAKSRTSSGAQQYRSQSAPVRSSRHENPEELCGDGFHSSDIQEGLPHGLGASQGSTNGRDAEGDSIPKQSTNGSGNFPQRKKFKAKPDVAWSCVRSRPATSFRGIEELRASYLPFDVEFALDIKRATFINRYISSRVLEKKGAIKPPSAQLLESHGLEAPPPPEAPIQLVPNPHPHQQTTTASFSWEILRKFIKIGMAINGYPVYYLTPKVFRGLILPPKGPYIVLGIFDESGILMDEVIVYMEGEAMSRQLVKERRRLFSLPILRDIKAFKLYKCDKGNKVHVQVEVTSEESDCLATFFECVDRWERYYRLKTFLIQYGALFFLVGGLGAQTMLVATVAILTIWGITRLSWFQVRVVNVPSPEEEREWRDWIHDSLNEKTDNPSKSYYSLMCVIGWSRFNIVVFIIIPFMMAVVGAIIFGIVWSLDIKSHKGDLAGAWAVSSFVITLAAGG
ncbi:hypothetical protein OIDMADRAFT_33596 [Oidiodendron maius Zn]|uniref:Uncharacterized protein n=1 Tax=Oidiodendron maius (strain Zn) TaxID=913774 RepID=A0A0C3H141_OIDMZ|nr:hypothetical protein OIDMADRAFT_33596 [Oidiodendron maius Zn]